MHNIIFIMGVSGSGKTTIGRRLAKQLDIPFFDADDYHSTDNIEKMKAGIPLTDADRRNWLQKMNELAAQHQTTKGAVIACSALKQSYREILLQHIVLPQWFFLTGSPQLILERMQNRTGHFMPPGLLQSQFDSLEPPSDAPGISIEQDPDSILQYMLSQLQTK